MITQYKKVTNFLDNTSNQTTKSTTKNWVEINNDLCGRQSTASQIKLKMSMLKSSLCDYSNSYILVSGTISVANTAA